jgi:hypothetical protein
VKAKAHNDGHNGRLQHGTVLSGASVSYLLISHPLSLTAYAWLSLTTGQPPARAKSINALPAELQHATLQNAVKVIVKDAKVVPIQRTQTI